MTHTSTDTGGAVAPDGATAAAPRIDDPVISVSGLTKQYGELLATEGLALEFTPDGIEAVADIAFEVNRTTQNIGARRLHTILERVVEDISFKGPDLPDKHVRIDGAYVRGQLQEIMEKEDLSKFIL